MAIDAEKLQEFLGRFVTDLGATFAAGNVVTTSLTASGSRSSSSGTSRGRKDGSTGSTSPVPAAWRTDLRAWAGGESSQRGR